MFTFLSGCTLIFNLDTLAPSYAIKKPRDERRIERQRRHLLGGWEMPERAVYSGGRLGLKDEPLALLHECH